MTFMRHVGSSGGKGHRPPILKGSGRFVAWEFRYITTLFTTSPQFGTGGTN